jgi:hypothetical protein
MLPRLLVELRAHRWACVALFSLIVAGGLARPAPSRTVTVGRVDQYPPGSITHIWLPVGFDDPLRPHVRLALPRPAEWNAPEQALAAIQILSRQLLTPPVGRVAAVPIFLVRDTAGSVVAFYDRDPLTGCRLAWQAAARRFDDGCSFSAYQGDGGYLRGPATRDLDRFTVAMTESGELVVDIGSFQRGGEHPWR